MLDRVRAVAQRQVDAIGAMRVHLGSDHAGFELKAHLIAHLASLGHEPVDAGPATYDASDDYPPYCIAAAQAVLDDPGSLGIVIGGSGNGEAIVANRVRGVRCGLCWTEQVAIWNRSHNDANDLVRQLETGEIQTR